MTPSMQFFFCSVDLTASIRYYSHARLNLCYLYSIPITIFYLCLICIGSSYVLSGSLISLTSPFPSLYPLICQCYKHHSFFSILNSQRDRALAIACDCSCTAMQSLTCYFSCILIWCCYICITPGCKCVDREKLY